MLREKHNHYPLAPDKVEIEREKLSEYQLEIANLNNITINNVKKIKKSMCFIMKTYNVT